MAQNNCLADCLAELAEKSPINTFFDKSSLRPRLAELFRKDGFPEEIIQEILVDTQLSPDHLEKYWKLTKPFCYYRIDLINMIIIPFEKQKDGIKYEIKKIPIGSSEAILVANHHIILTSSRDKNRLVGAGHYRYLYNSDYARLYSDLERDLI